MLTDLFLAFVVLNLGVRIWLSTRQIAHVRAHRGQVPEAFASRISLQSHQRAADYTIARARLGMWHTLYDTVILLALTLGGGLHVMDGAVGAVATQPLWHGLLLLAFVGVVLGVLSLPFTIWKQFRLEANFGFNRMTPSLFVSDLIKGALIAAVLGLPLAAVVLALMHQAGANWWFWAWLVWAVFNILVMAIFPTFIAPLFNKFKPLQDPSLVERIQALARRCEFPLQGLFVMDGSKRSAHGNAYFTGFGRSRRIVFFDTLLERLTGEEVEAVLAHELGHYKRHHILKRIVFMMLMALVFFAVLGWVSAKPWFYAQLGAPLAVGQANDALALILFFLIVPVFTFVFTPVSSRYSRKHEFEADAYARSHSDAAQLTAALVKLYDDNAATLTPDPVHSAFYDSHPNAAIRIARLSAAHS